jgi:uncharacterized protein
LNRSGDECGSVRLNIPFSFSLFEDLMKIRFWFVAACLLVGVCGAVAQAPVPSQEEFIKTHYAKYEYRIPMRDGAKLFVSVYTPQVGAFKDLGPTRF